MAKREKVPVVEGSMYPIGTPVIVDLGDNENARKGVVTAIIKRAEGMFYEVARYDDVGDLQKEEYEMDFVDAAP